MDRADPELLQALKSLPPAHKRFITADAPNAWRRGTKTRDARLEHLAATLGAEGLTRYDGLYLKGNHGLFTWYVGAAIR